MAKECELVDFYRRFQTLQIQRETSDGLIKELISYTGGMEETLRAENESLRKEAKNRELDLADSIISRRELQNHIEYYQTELFRLTKDNESLKFRNPYVAILIDGNGLVFQDRFVQRGVEGGKAAADQLRRLVVYQCGQFASTMEVQCKVVANLHGLARTMVRDGGIWKAEDLRDFFWGFTQANPSFDFVDVGQRMDSTAAKIKENTKWHLQNSNCKQICLGISHDNGYAPFLDNLMKDDMVRRQLTILEGVPTVKEIFATGINVFREDKDLFRKDRLAKLTPIERGPFERTMSHEYSAPSSMTGSPQATSATTVPTPIGTNTNSPSTSWAGMAQKIKPATPPPVITLPLANRTNGKDTPAAKPTRETKPIRRDVTPVESILDGWNPGERGLDKSIHPVQSVLDQIKKRKDNNKICNNHFLRGPCTKRGCEFVHEYDPTEDELTVIAYLARLNPCTRAQSCDNDECIYGHHCQSMKGDTCLHPFCKYPEDAHPPGTKYKNVHIDKNH